MQWTKHNGKKRKKNRNSKTEYKQVCSKSLFNALSEAGDIDDALTWKTYSTMLNQ